MSIRLQNADTTDLLLNIYLLEDKIETSATTEDDIYGAPVVVTKELPAGSTTWTMGAAYQTVQTAQACIAAFQAGSALMLTDELNFVESVVITDYPAIERVKSGVNVLYNVKLTLTLKSGGFQLPPVLTTSGPRLFDR